MPLRRQTQVMAELDRMTGRRVGRAAKQYRAETLGPIVNAISDAGSAEAALNALGPTLFRRMGTDAMETALAENEVQTACIGRTSARPRE